MIEIDSLQVAFKNKLALDIDRPIVFQEGDRVGIIGSNGAGKTTLLKTILGLYKYDGTIKKDIPAEQISVHMQINEYNDIVPIKVIIEMITGKAIKDNPKIKELIEFFDFSSSLNKRWKHLSGGQKQRLTLILVMAQERPITMLDEVTSGLDFETRSKLVDKLVDWYGKLNTTLLITSHYYEELDNLTNKILFLDKGKVIDYGDKDVLFNKYCGKSVIVCHASEQAQEIAGKERQLAAPEGMIAISCENEQEEAEVAKKLIAANINYRRSNNDIEIMTINAKRAYYGGDNNAN